MAFVYGKVESLERLLSFFARERITFLSSLDDIISFKKDYEAKIDEAKKEVLSDIVSEIEGKKEDLSKLTEAFTKKLTERESILIEERGAISKKVEELSIKTTNIFLWIYNNGLRPVNCIS